MTAESECGVALGVRGMGETKSSSAKTYVRRLDLAEELVRKAKQAHSLKKHGVRKQDLTKIEFREMLDGAVDDHLPHLVEVLKQVGIAKSQGKISKRPRSVSKETWNRLGEICEGYDISRIQLIRALLFLLSENPQK